jgi:hypothetical protein
MTPGEVDAVEGARAANRHHRGTQRPDLSQVEDVHPEQGAEHSGTPAT